MNFVTKEKMLEYWGPFTERCGYIFRSGEIIEIPNTAINPRRTFSMDLADLLSAFRGKDPSQVVGIFHTHPSNSPSPSKEDVQGWPEQRGLRYLIVTKDDIFEWTKDVSGSVRPVGNGPALVAEVHSLAKFKRQRDLGNSR